jgi:hypothetical protein
LARYDAEWTNAGVVERQKMDRETFTETIRAFRNRTPFRPFTVALVNGDRYEVDHPEALAVRDGLALFAAPGNVPVIFDHEGVSQVIGDLSGHGAETS